LDSTGRRGFAGGPADDSGNVGAAAVHHQPQQKWLLRGEECAAVTQSVMMYVAMVFLSVVEDLSVIEEVTEFVLWQDQALLWFLVRRGPVTVAINELCLKTSVSCDISANIFKHLNQG
jgi:hypothetical protein